MFCTCVSPVRVIPLLLLALLASDAAAHSFLVDPPGDWRSIHRAQCRIGGPKNTGEHCPGPCIKEGSYWHHASAPRTTWWRGQVVPVTWTRNNHRHGFVRLSLVPLAHRMDRAAHERNAFHFACFESRKARCDATRYFCGTDKYTFSTAVTVPDVPNGKYVLGWTWYGAFAWHPDKGMYYNFGDYWSCAYIIVSGGRPNVARQPHPTPQAFVSGIKGQYKCKSMTDRMGVCVKEPCFTSVFRGPPKYWLPYGYKNVPVPQVQAPREIQRKQMRACKCPGFAKELREKPCVATLWLRPLTETGHLRGPGFCLCEGSVVPEYEFGVSIVAEFSCAVHRVSFFYNNRFLHKEKFAPYAILANKGPVYNEFRSPAVGEVVAISTKAMNKRGSIIAEKYLHISFKG